MCENNQSPIIVQNLEEMGHEYANPKGKSWERGNIAAVMILAAENIRELRTALEAMVNWSRPDTGLSSAEGHNLARAKAKEILGKE